MSQYKIGSPTYCFSSSNKQNRLINRLVQTPEFTKAKFDQISIEERRPEIFESDQINQESGRVCETDETSSTISSFESTRYIMLPKIAVNLNSTTNCRLMKP
jgi:hypothetical protein